MIYEKKRTKYQERAAIYDELMRQLRGRAADTTVFESMVSDYVRYWEYKELLKASIKKTGLVYTDWRGDKKPAPELKEIQNISRLMLAILKEMDLKTGNVTGDEDAL